MSVLPAALPARTLVDTLPTPRTLPHPLIDALWIFGASLLVSTCAQVSIPLPFTPVPISGQTLAVLLAGITLGPRRGMLAMLLYLLEGASGLPVFAHGAAGTLHLVGPTAGYLWSFPLAAGFVGWLAAHGWDRRPLTAGLAMLLGSTIILCLGTLWLSRFVGGLPPAFLKGCLPFLPGDLIKTTLAAALFPSAWALVRRSGVR